MANKIGKIDKRVVSLLGLNVKPGTDIYIGNSNVQHMMSSHPNDYAQYGHLISTILASPDYVGLNTKDNSIEYVKEFKHGNDHVKVAVRASSGQKFFARSLYVLNNNRVRSFIRKGTLKKY